MNLLLLNFGYVLMVGALVMRDVLWLRMTMVLAQSVLGLYAWSLGLTNAVVWNAAFVTINVAWTVRILRERRAVTLPEHLKPLYEEHFSALTPAEFLKWWKLGRRETRRDERMTTLGAYPDALYFLLDGAARVTRQGDHVADLAAGQFIAEMSLLTGKAANADVFAAGTIDVMRWDVGDLKDLRGRDPGMWARVLSAIGQDLVVKIQRAEVHGAPAAPAILSAAV